MERINTTNKAVDLFGVGKDGFRDGNPSSGIFATLMSAAIMNALQEEVANTIEFAGITLNGADRTQLRQAIQQLIGAQGNPKSLFEFLSSAQIADVRAGTLAIDCTAGIQNWINYLSTTACVGVAPYGTYLQSGSVQVKNNVTIIGSGLRAKFHYTGAGDQWYTSNPSNSSTPATINIRDLWLHRTTATAGKANYADNGSTYLTIKGCWFSGAAINVIFDQTELADVEECNFGAIGTVGIWLVNGAERTAGNSPYFTNRISVSRCQFNGPTTAGTCAIADDGGRAHTFQDNNYNALDKHIRSYSCTGLLIIGGESELANTAGFDFSATKLAGGVNGGATMDSCSIEGLLCAGNVLDVKVAASTLKHLRYVNNVTSHAGSPLSGVNNCVSVFAQGNTNISTGDGIAQLNNHFEDISWTPNLTFGGAQVGMTQSVQFGRCSRDGKQVTVTGRITLTAKGSSAGGVEINNLPWAAQAVTNYLAVGNTHCTNMAALNSTPWCIAPEGATVAQLFQLTANSAAILTEGNFTNASSVIINLVYETVNNLN